MDTDKSRKEHYKKYLNNLTHVKNLAKHIYYKNLIKCNKNNPSQTGSIIKEIIDYKNSARKTVLPSAITIKDESVISDTLKFAKSLCKYLANIGSKLSLKLLCSDTFSCKIHRKSCMHFFMPHEITQEEVSNCISNIKPYFVQVMDKIPPKFVKLAKCILSPYLAKLFSKCIEQEIFSRDFKVANILPMSKF